MTDQLGIPVWGSYIIFGLATLFSGLALGLVSLYGSLPVQPGVVLSRGNGWNRRRDYMYDMGLEERERAGL